MLQVWPNEAHLILVCECHLNARVQPGSHRKAVERVQQRTSINAEAQRTQVVINNDFNDDAVHTS